MGEWHQGPGVGVLNNIYVRRDGTTPLTGNWNAGNYEITINSLVLPEISEPTGILDSAKLYAFDFHGITQLYYKNSDDFLTNLGRDNLIVVANKTGSDIGKCAVVYVNDSLGNVPTVDLAKADSETTMPSLGIVAELIADNGFGRVMTYGKIIKCDTSGFDEGDPLYVSPVTAGLLTNVKPGYPDIIQRVGIVLVSGVGTGSIEVDTQAMISTNVVPYTGAVADVNLGSHDFFGRVITGSRFVSTVATGTSPFSCTSVTLNANLNADMLDGKHVGTSGNAVPLLDGANTWSGNQLFGADGAGVDVTFNTLTSGSRLFWDASEGQLTHTLVPGKLYQWMLTGTDNVRALSQYLSITPTLTWSGEGSYGTNVVLLALTDSRTISSGFLDYLYVMNFQAIRTSTFSSNRSIDHFIVGEYVRLQDAGTYSGNARLYYYPFEAVGVSAGAVITPKFTGTSGQLTTYLLYDERVVAQNAGTTATVTGKGGVIYSKLAYAASSGTHTIRMLEFLPDCDATGSATLNICGLYYDSSACSGFTTNYAVYALTGDIALVSDTTKIVFGAGLDVFINYTGTVWDFDIAFATTEIVFNNSGFDTNFRIEGDTDANLFFCDAGRDNIGIGTNAPAVSAKLEVSSTTGAVLLPRMSTAQRDALTAVFGMIIYNTGLGVFQGYTGAGWANL